MLQFLYPINISNIWCSRWIWFWQSKLFSMTHIFTMFVSIGLVTWHQTSDKPLPELRIMGRWVNTLRLRQNGRHFLPDDIFKCIFLNENTWISIKISLKFVPKGPINKIPALVQIMAWRRSGDKPLSEPMMASLLTHICITRPQWVKLFGTEKVKDTHSVKFPLRIQFC